jgi:DNA-binding XRE family transcriptional regulator
MWSTVRHVRQQDLQMIGRVQEGYLHTLRNAHGNLYLAVRRYLGLSRDQFAHKIGISTYSLRYRERAKRLYHTAEIAALHQVSGMTSDQFTKLLNDIA